MASSPDTYLFRDDGTFPNSRFPVLVYQRAIDPRERDPARVFEEMFGRNGWGGASWRNGLYQYHHYHSTAHEVLGIFSGRVRLQLGGERGRAVTANTGDVLIIPAGVAHKNVAYSGDYRVVGAYPDGTSPDLQRGSPGERPKADQNIARLAMPDADPVAGRRGHLIMHWSRAR